MGQIGEWPPMNRRRSRALLACGSTEKWEATTASARLIPVRVNEDELKVIDEKAQAFGYYF